MGRFAGRKKFTSEDPDQFSYLSSLETKRNIGDSYGRKIRASLSPPEDGEYTFWILSDDSSILQLLNQAQKTSGKSLKLIRTPVIHGMQV